MWKQKKQILYLVLAPMILNSPMALAGEGADESKWYLGAGLGISRLAPESNGSIYSVEDKSSEGFKLTLGYDWSERVSIEGYYSDLGEAVMSPNGEVSYKDLGASGLYYFYQQHDKKHRGWEAFVKTGLGWMKNDTELNYERLHNTHLMFGLGGGYTFNNGLSIRADLDLYDEDSQFLTLSLMKRFGQKRLTQKPEQQEVVTEVTAAPVAVPLESNVDPVIDSDGDGVQDSQDQCPDTPKGGKVNDRGCLVLLELEGVHFENDEYKLTESSKRILDNVAAMLKDRSDIKQIKVVGHTDNRGAAGYNQQLSESRAIRVRDYLISAGIPGYLLKAVGLGESQPIASNKSESGRQQNRRVELQLSYK
jgi:outer membrane protein OmpA-like peptidoglycan-associated protein